MKKFKFFTILLAIMMTLVMAAAPAFATALSADKTAISYTSGDTMSFSVEESTTLYLGALVMVNAAGYAIPGSDTAGGIFQGINLSEKVDNSSGSDGDATVVLTRSGCYLMTFDTAITIANVGDNVFLVDDQTVDVVGNVSNAIYCGIITKYVTTTTAWVDITPAIQQADVATHIADTSAAHAASAISITDSGGYTIQTTVEAAQQELFKQSTTVIADPGDGGAIPVTKSGTCAITTTGVDDTRTLAIPTFAGQVLDISLTVDAGDAVITVAAACNQTGNTTLTGADAGDHIRLVGVTVGGALVWRIAANDGWALSTP
jgi:hypothetical protein